MPIVAKAVTLGDLTVKSYLNQPMDAYINLSGLSNTPLSEIKIKLASPEAFKHVNVPRPYSLSKFRYEVKNFRGRPVVKITSHERIDEPYVQILLDVAWSKGQSYRLYTILLDPPGYTKALKAKAAPSYRPRYQQAGSKNKPISSSVIRKPIPVNDDSDIATTYGPTTTQDDLWQIARRYRTSGLSLYQVMQAIVVRNPSAFVSGNVNGLKKGVRLKIPTAKYIQSIPAHEAYEYVQAQNTAWKNRGKKGAAAIQPLTPAEPPRTIKGKSITIKAAQHNIPQLDEEVTEPKLPTPKATATPETPPQPDPKPKAELEPKPKPKTEPKLAPQNVQLLNQTAPEKKTHFLDESLEVPQFLTKIIKEPKPSAASKQATTPVVQALPVAIPKATKPQDKLLVAALEKVKESNSLLRKQLKVLLDQNKSLKERESKQNSEIDVLKQRLSKLTQALENNFQVNEKGQYVLRNSVASESHGDAPGNALIDYLLYLCLAIVLAGGAGLGLFYFWQHRAPNLTPSDEAVDEEEAEATALAETEDGEPIKNRRMSERRQIDDKGWLEERRRIERRIAERRKAPHAKRKDGDERRKLHRRNSERRNEDRRLDERREPDTDEKPIEAIEQKERSEERRGEEQRQSERRDSERRGQSAIAKEIIEGRVQEDDRREEERRSEEERRQNERRTEETDTASDDNSIEFEPPEQKEGLSLAGDAGDKKMVAQLSLAETFIAMEDFDGAKTCLEEVLEHGDGAQKQKANELLQKIAKT